MLRPTFNERTALDIKARIVKWLLNHFMDSANWEVNWSSGNFTTKHYRYKFPTVQDLANSGIFDDTADSIVLRVLKDMNGFGNLQLRSNPASKHPATREIVLNRSRMPLPEGVTATDGSYRTSDLSVLGGAR
jgi:hypothetical protein